MDIPAVFLLDAPPKANADASWVQVAKTGKFSDPRYGNFTITTKDFDRWLSNFDANVGHGPLGLPVDVDHSPEKRGDTEAMGWVKALERRGNEMWAKVDWNDLGKQLIESRRYAYISPSYSNDFKDESGKSHGTALVGIALTNRPFLQMATVNLSKFVFARATGGDDQGLDPDETTDLGGPTMAFDSDGGGDTDLDDMDFSQACAGGKTPDGYNDSRALDDVMLNISDSARKAHAVVVKKINGTTRHMFPIPPGDKGHARAALRLLPRAIKAGHISTQEAAAIRSRAAGVLGHSTSSSKQHSYSLDQMELDQIINAMGLSRETLGVAADADEETVLTAIKTHNEKRSALPEGVVTLSADKLAELTTQAAAGQAAAEQLRVNRFETAFDKAQSDGKVVPSQKETFLEIYNNNAETALKLLDGLQPVVNMTPLGHNSPSPNLDPTVRSMASEYVDENHPGIGVDTDGLRVLARADQIEAEQKVPFETALAMAEAELAV